MITEPHWGLPLPGLLPIPPAYIDTAGVILTHKEGEIGRGILRLVDLPNPGCKNQLLSSTVSSQDVVPAAESFTAKAPSPLYRERSSPLSRENTIGDAEFESSSHHIK